MKKFMIGQYDTFDYKKFHRDFRKEFYGIEACLFENQDDVTNLVKESKEKGFKIGIHFPLRYDESKLRDPLFLSPDNKIRKDAYEYIQKELNYLLIVKPKYILFHYPKPVILDERVDWSKWRFYDKSEYIYENDYSFNEFKEKSEYLFEWLTKKSEEYEFIPVLEFDALNKYIYEFDFVEELLKRYEKVRLCLDIGRLHLQDKIDLNFDSKQIINKYAKYAEVIHLSNVKINEELEKYHYPVLPELNTNEGWAPVEEYLQIIRKENPNVNILFEHRSDLISDAELEKCYLWVDRLLNKVIE